MVSFHVWTFVWILVLLFVFSTIADANNTKHRTAHHHGHHRHRHRKHSKPHSRLIKKSSSEDNIRRRNNMALISSSTPWFLNETSKSLNSSTNNYSDYDKLLSKSVATVRSTNINLKNKTYVKNFIPEQVFNRSLDTAINNDSSHSISKNNIVNLPIFDAVTIDREIGETMNKSEETKDTAVTDSRSSSISNQEKEHRTFPKELERLFGSTEDHTSFPKILTDPPNVLLIRKKRSISSEEIDANNEKIKQPTLLSLDGPPILNDPEETAERESSESLHIRVKRDGSEYDESPSVISSQDSNYLQDLENSFALSALEIEARDLGNSGIYRRESRSGQASFDSSLKLSRPKREADDKNWKNNNDDFLVTSEIPALSNAISKEDNDSSFNETLSNEHLLETTTWNLSNSSSNRSEENTDITIDPVIKDFETSTNNRWDPQKLDNNSYSFDSSTIFSQSTVEDSIGGNETDITYLPSSSQSSDSTDSIGKEDEPITGYRIEDPENDDKANFDSSINTEASKRKVEAMNYHPEVSSSVDSSLKDEDSMAKNGLDDVYPDTVEDVSNRSAMVQLVRTKRFSDAIINPEASEISYSNDRISDEPYAEDNRIIDSILSKVDYRNADEPKRSERSINKETILENGEMYSSKRDDPPLRINRGISSRKTRKKGGGNRYFKKRKKSRKSRAKKHHRPRHKRLKVKRESEDLSERAENKLELENENFTGEKLDAMEQDIISPHDGRRRREYEDEEDLYPDAKESETRERREFRESEDNGELSVADNDKEIARCVDARSKLYEEAKTREKRDNSLQELKYFQNVRETDGGQNRSGDIADKILLRAEAIKPIKDIERLAEELVAKVNELHLYINLAGVTENFQSSGTSSSVVDSSSAEGSKIVKRVTSSGNLSSKSATAANVVRRAEACWKSSENSASPKSDENSKTNSRGQRCSKKIRRKRTSHRKWDRWTDWSSCSVTCGRGRQIRWRHCIRNCSTAETEMEEKACQLPACAPGKFLGIFG